MFLLKSLKNCLLTMIALLLTAPAWAAGPPDQNPLYNPLAIMLICIMVILLIAIGILASVLTGAADVSLIKWKKKKEHEKKLPVGQAAAIFIGFMFLSLAIFAQNNPTSEVVQTAPSIGGLSPLAFYVMISIVFLELIVIMALLINLRLLIKSQRETAAVETEVIVENKKRISWWSHVNKFRLVEKDQNRDLGHEYDSIRELNNHLKPWRINWFYVTMVFAAMVFAGIYLWRDNVSHPAGKEASEIAVQKADHKVTDYPKQKAEAIDENAVTLLGPGDITEGKRIFQISCTSCHNEGGAGSVGPNLTDDYWLHGGDIKSVFKTIKYGINAMPTWQNSYSNKEIAQLASYVKSLKGTNPTNAKAPQGELYKEETAAPKSTPDSTAAKKDNKTAAL